MIKSVGSLRDAGLEKASNFLKTCQVYEKLDMFYFKMKVLSKDSVIFFKSNGKEIKIEDIVLSKMWNDPVLFFSKLVLSKQDIIESLIGYSFGFFYLPVAKPLRVDYSSLHDAGIRYILSDVEDPKGNLIRADVDHSKSETAKAVVKMFGGLSSVMISDREILKTEKGSSFDEARMKEAFCKPKDDNSVERVILETLKSSKGSLASYEAFGANPEGFIFKKGKANYQIKLLNESESAKVKSSSKLGMEFVIVEFCKWAKSTDYTKFMSKSYIETVCSLFEAFCTTHDFSSFDLYKTNPEELEAPTFGYYSGMCYDYIPNESVKKLCHEDKMKENIFKILLNGLKKEKSKNAYLLIDDSTRKVWNDLVKMISKSVIVEVSNR